jgi:hypothetical protein
MSRRCRATGNILTPTTAIRGVQCRHEIEEYFDRCCLQKSNLCPLCGIEVTIELPPTSEWILRYSVTPIEYDMLCPISCYNGDLCER